MRSRFTWYSKSMVLYELEGVRKKEHEHEEKNRNTFDGASDGADDDDDVCGLRQR